MTWGGLAVEVLEWLGVQGTRKIVLPPASDVQFIFCDRG